MKIFFTFVQYKLKSLHIYHLFLLKCCNKYFIQTDSKRLGPSFYFLLRIKSFPPVNNKSIFIQINLPHYYYYYYFVVFAVPIATALRHGQTMVKEILLVRKH